MLEHKVEVDGGASRMTEGLLVGQSEFGKGKSGKDREHRELVDIAALNVQVDSRRQQTGGDGR